MGLNLLYMRGPDIPLHISMSGSTETDFVSEFESGGINQTVHKLSLTITTDMTVLVPPVSENTSVTTTVVIAETIIVGEVRIMLFMEVQKILHNYCWKFIKSLVFICCLV